MRGKFASNMILIGKAEYYQQNLQNKIESGSCTANDITEFNGIMNEIYAEFDKYKDYKEPYGFSESSMELWWAIVNTRLASETLVSIANGGDRASLMQEYITYRNDSMLQRQRAMVQLYSDVMSVAFMWD